MNALILLLLLLTGFAHLSHAFDEAVKDTPLRELFETNPLLRTIRNQSSVGHKNAPAEESSEESSETESSEEERPKESLPNAQLSYVPIYKKKHVFHNSEQIGSIEKLAVDTYTHDCLISLIGLKSDGTINGWQRPTRGVVKNARPLSLKVDENNIASAIAMHKDRIYVGDKNGAIRMFDLADGRANVLCKFGGGIYEILFGDTNIYTQYGCNNIAILDKNGKPIQQLTVNNNDTEDIVKIMVHNNILYAYGDEGTINRFDQRTWQVIDQQRREQYEKDPIYLIIGTPAHYYMLTEENGLVQCKNHKETVVSKDKKVAIAAYGDNALFTAYDKKNTVSVRNFETADYLYSLATPLNNKPVTALTYDDENHSLYIGYNDGTVVEWSTQVPDDESDSE